MRRRASASRAEGHGTRADPVLASLTVHIWEYEGLPGFEKTKNAVRESEVRSPPPPQASASR